MLTENICCNCHWYEGVSAVPGTAPCSKHNKQVLWNEDCDEIWLIPERLKIKKENHMSIIINGIKMPEDPDEMIELAIFGDGKVIQTGESWRSPEDGKCYYTTTTPEKFGSAVSVPEHGRLGDLDEQDAQIEALIERHLHGYTKSTWDFVCELRDILKRNPTVIPKKPTT